jgi:sugar phosphate isomerase/epimerase
MTAGSSLGIQLYSVRDDIGPGGLDDTLARLAAVGFTHVEPYDILTDTDGLEAALRRTGLHASTTHANIVALDETAVLDAAARLGIAADRGIRIGYHNHDFEFAQHVDGVPVYELFVDLLDPAVVLELDVYWAGVGGADVFELLPRLGDRVRFLHVVRDREPGNDRPVLGVDATGRMDEVLALAAQTLELPIVEVVAHHSDVFPLVESNAAFFRGLVAA